MREMSESVAQYGVLVPVIVREMDNDEATNIMVDSNLQREKILLSEKAFAYRMKLEAMKHQGQRTDLTSGPVGPKWSREAVSVNSPDSARQIQRFIRLTELVPGLLALVDQEKFPLRPAVEVSYLTQDEQELLYDVMENNSFGPPSIEQAKKIREYGGRTDLTTSLIIDILSDKKPPPVKITLKKEYLSQYFPKDCTQQQMEEVILTLFKNWKSQQKGAVSNDNKS